MIVLTFLDWVGLVSSALLLVSLILGTIAWLRGIIPALYRLGKGLSKRKIAIFAKGDNLTGMMNLLEDTKLLSKRNIITIASDNDLGRGEKATLFLVHWDDWENKIEDILDAKKDATALVVYAPRQNSIPPDKFLVLNKHRNVTVTNFRGRLLNDIIVSLMTTSYQ
ncbi:MAG: hypothetical protein ACR2H5_22035 [Ktedonobacteraceae bacterium]